MGSGGLRGVSVPNEANINSSYHGYSHTGGHTIAGLKNQTVHGSAQNRGGIKIRNYLSGCSSRRLSGPVCFLSEESTNGDNFSLSRVSPMVGVQARLVGET